MGEVGLVSVVQRRQVMPARSYLSQVERTLTFGLGKAETIDLVRIRWTDGSIQEIRNPRVNATLRVKKPIAPERGAD